MELHLPYLTLRGSRGNSPFSYAEKGKDNRRPWADLTFLDQHIYKIGLRGRSIYAAHATIVVTGWDRSKYTAYSFLDPGPTTQSPEDEEGDEECDEEDDPEDGEILDSELLPEDAEDEFATHGWQECLHLNDSISSWDPRVRFLRAVQIKVTVAFQEYDYLIGSFFEFMTRVRFSGIYFGLSLL